MHPQDQVRALQYIKQGFQELGYVGGLLQQDYAFADVLATGLPVIHIPLAAFVQEPPSYRTASFGVAVANGLSGAEAIKRHRSLGAPQILEIGDDRVFRWRVNGRGEPDLLEQVVLEKLPGLFAQHRDDWSPQRMIRAKSAAPLGTQLDFFDLGLLPLLDYQVRTKLDQLLRDTVTLAIKTFEKQAKFADGNYPPLFRLIFRLIAAKVLDDRCYPGNWVMDDPGSVINAVEEFYFQGTEPEPVLQDPETRLEVWQHIRSAFHFQNLSVDSLAYIYENTLVTPRTRRLFGIHSTPPAIAEYIVRKLPFETLEVNERRVFEPFSGHSVFLVAAMQRMRELLPNDMTADERHQYFVEMLSGIEIDDFAREVARLSLMLADYPNPDGWRLHSDDALASPLFEQELRNAGIVLCNPPFEKFSPDDRATHHTLSSVWKPAEILYRVLQNPPKLLGFVLPRVFLTGHSYRELRSLLGTTYSSIEVLALPDRVFQYSNAEAVLLLCSGCSKGRVHFMTGEVYKWDLKDTYAIHASHKFDEDVEDAGKVFAHGMWRPPLQEVWQATAKLRRLGELVSVHRGIEYNLPFAENEASLVAHEVHPGFVPGVHVVQGAVEPFVIIKPVFLNASLDLMRTFAHTFPWHEPKLVVNASRQSRGPWNFSASLDYKGLICYRNFHGVWPKGDLALEVLAAVLNGPVANAFVSTLGGNRYIRANILKDIPVPEFDQTQQQIIASMVRQYSEARHLWLSGQLAEDEAHERCSQLLRSIDAEVLRAYDLPPRIERMLLDYFAGHPRLGPVEFTEYFPPSFKPYIPWHTYISEDFKDANASNTLKRLPVIPASSLLDEALSYVE